MSWIQLQRHQNSAVHASLGVYARAYAERSDLLVLCYRVTGPVSDVLVPAQQSLVRLDELWRTTCFEAFISPPFPADMTDKPYWEINLSPSRRWASYEFAGYRNGMKSSPDIIVEDISMDRATDRFEITAHVRVQDGSAIEVLSPDTGATAVGLSCILESTDGGLSYWALSHGPGEPDFHHPDGFKMHPFATPSR